MSASVGMEDLRRSFEFLPLSGQLALADVRVRYSRSLLGPLWISATMLAVSAAIAFLMTGLFGGSLRDFLPFVMAGIILWTFIAQSTLEACGMLIGARSHLLGAPLPYSTFAYSVILRNFIYLLHHLAAYVVIVVVIGVFPSPTWFVALPGLLLVVAAVAGLVLMFGSLTPRYRDLLPLVSIMTGVGALITPVYWKPELLVKNQVIAAANPFTHLLAVVREPLNNHLPTPANWGVALVFAAVMLGAGLLTFLLTRRRLPFWI